MKYQRKSVDVKIEDFKGNKIFNSGEIIIPKYGKNILKIYKSVSKIQNVNKIKNSAGCNQYDVNLIGYRCMD